MYKIELERSGSTSMLFGYEMYTADRSVLIRELDARIADRKHTTVVSLNTLKLYQGAKDPYLETLFQTGDFIIPDGQSMVLAEALVNRNSITAISGAELMVKLIDHAAEMRYRLFFLGSPQSLLDKVKAKINSDYPDLRDTVAFQHGYYDSATEESAILDKIAAFRPDILFVAFGSPRKEEFIVTNRERCGAIVSMGVGGSYEFFVGEVKLDGLTKRLGLRWLVRTLQDPWRLAGRYARCNTYFVWALLREMFVKRKPATPSIT